MKKFLTYFFIVVAILLTVIIGLISFTLNYDPNALELEDIYNETKSTEDLYNLCTALQETNYYNKIIEYYTILLLENNVEEFIKNDEYWYSSLENMSAEEIKSIYVVVLLDAVLENEGEAEYSKYFDAYIDSINFTLHEDGVPILSVMELYFFDLTGIDISGLDNKNIEIYLEKLSLYINSSSKDIEVKDYVNLFIYNWYSKINQLEKMNTQRTFVSKPFTYRDFFSFEKDLTGGYVLAFDSSDNKAVVGKNSYNDFFLIDVGYDVQKYANNDKYICIQRIHENQELYYIIDTETNILFRELDEKTYEKKCQELNISLELIAV